MIISSGVLPGFETHLLQIQTRCTVGGQISPLVQSFKKFVHHGFLHEERDMACLRRQNYAIGSGNAIWGSKIRSIVQRLIPYAGNAVSNSF